jgi:hypothetical protein
MTTSLMARRTLDRLNHNLTDFFFTVVTVILTIRTYRRTTSRTVLDGSETVPAKVGTTSA